MLNLHTGRYLEAHYAYRILAVTSLIASIKPCQFSCILGHHRLTEGIVRMISSTAASSLFLKSQTDPSPNLMRIHSFIPVLVLFSYQRPRYVLGLDLCTRGFIGNPNHGTYI